MVTETRDGYSDDCDHEGDVDDDVYGHDDNDDDVYRECAHGGGGGGS